MQLYEISLLAMLCVAATTTQAGTTVLFSDNFKAGQAWSGMNNALTYAGRQSCTVAAVPVTWKNGTTTSWIDQIVATGGPGGAGGGYFFVACDGNYTGASELYYSPGSPTGLNFTNAPGTKGYTAIDMDLNPCRSGVLSSWVSINFGCNAQTEYAKTSTGMGVLIRGDGLFSVYNKTIQVVTNAPSVFTNSSWHHLQIRIYTPGYNSSYANTIAVYDNGATPFTNLNVSAGNGFSKNYISIGGNSANGNAETPNHGFGNFKVSLVGPPNGSAVYFR
ncbi:MAG: hypothetical protein WCR06_08875 [bacterium]